MKTDLTIEIVHKANTSTARLFTPKALGSDGDHLFINSRFRFYRRDADAPVKMVESASSLNTFESGLVVTKDALWAHGQEGIVRSVDDGASFSPVSLPWEGAVRSMAIAPDGALWAGDADGVVLVKESGAKKFTVVKGPAPAVTVMASSRRGVLVGDEEGRLWIGTGGGLKATALNASEPIRAIFETSKGTILVIAGAQYNSKPSVSRSADGGKSFKTTSFAKGSLLTIGEVPAGPVIVAGWDGVIAASSDDGQSFERVKHQAGTPKKSFECCAVYRGALVLGGDFQNLVSVAMAAKAAPPNKKASASKG